MPIFDTNSIIAYICGLMLAYVAIILLTKPIRWMLKLCISSVFGGLVLIVINLLGARAGFHMGINFATSTIVGSLGLPGVIMLYLIQVLL